MEPDGPGWEQQQDNEERQWFEEVQETLKADSEAFWKWCEQIDKFLEETCHRV